MRREWAPQDEASLCVAEPPALLTIQQRQTSSNEECGVRYQRCGGGVRILRKRIGGY